MNALLVICGLGVVSLIAEIANFRKWLSILLIIGLVAAVFLVAQDFGTTTFHFSEMLLFDNFSLAFTSLIIFTTLLWLLMARGFVDQMPHVSDRSALILFTVAGAVIMTSFNNMAMLFLGIEILSISLYVLAGSRKESLLSTEAAFKYFLMGSFATGFLLMGIALVYGATGSYHIQKIAAVVSEHGTELPTFFYAGVLMMMIGLAFKISAAPFHFWAPDVYEGSPTPVTAFMSTVVKIAAIAAFFRIFASCFAGVEAIWITPVKIMMVVTLVLANITAVYQNSVKRILAYSSVGHVGYILLAFVSNSAASSGAVFYYLSAYAVASITAFTVLQRVETSGPIITVDHFNGLFKKNPLLAVGMTFALLSLAGIPPLPGFFGKYMVFALAIENGNTGLTILAVITSLIGVYYYFRVIIAMFFKEPEGESLRVSTALRLLIYALVLVSIALSIFPDRVLALIS